MKQLIIVLTLVISYWVQAHSAPDYACDLSQITPDRLLEIAKLSEPQARIEFEKICEQINAAVSSVSRLAYSDQLTGLNNRHALEVYWNNINWQYTGETRRSQDIDMPLYVVMIDIDKFKSVNDTYGHEVGDEVLVRVASILKTGARAQDFVGRLGGEEFIMILRAPNDATVARLLNRLKTKIGETVFSAVVTAKGEKQGQREEFSRSASFGVVSTTSSAETLKELKEQADTALYHSKENGRNRITFFNCDLALNPNL